MEKSEEQKRFEKEVNDTINNVKLEKQNTTNEIKVCDTPKILIECGMKPLPMLYRKGHLRYALKEKDNKKHYHGLTIEQIYNLPKNISEPALIIRNKDENKQNCPILILNDFDVDKLPIFVVIEMNSIGTYDLKQINTNDILSIYGRKNFEEYLDKVIEKDGLIYYDKEKVHNIDTYGGLQLSNMCINYEPNKILQQINENVNNKIEKNDKKSEEKNMKKNNFYEDLTDNQKRALKETEEQYLQTYYGQYKENEVDIQDLIKFYKNNMLDNDANDFRDKYMREVIEKEVEEEEKEKENDIVAKINNLVEIVREQDYKEKFSSKEEGFKHYMSLFKEDPYKLLNNITDSIKGNLDKDFYIRINEIENDINNYIEKKDKEILKKYMDLLEINSKKTNDDKFYEEINKMTKEEQKELIIKAYKYNDNMNTQELVNKMEQILQQNGINCEDIKEKYNPFFYKVYNTYDGKELLYIGYDYKKANEVMQQKIEDTNGECKVFVDKVDKNFICCMEKIVEDYYKDGNISLNELHTNLINSFNKIYGEPKYKDSGEFVFEWFREYDKYKNGYCDYSYERLYRGNLKYDNLLEKYNHYTHNSKLANEELEKAFESKTWMQRITILQNKIAKFEPVETNQINKNTLKL